MKGIAALALYFILLTQATYAQQTHRFFHLTSTEGLSHDHVNAIVKGSRGFIWIATDDGLNRYDGYQFNVYRHDRDDPKSIRDNLVFDIVEENDQFWIGTGSGLDILDRLTDHFTHYSPPIVKLAV
ncbi:MAG TPA: two-component regulator propeller domain-containing protein, partial [Cyclobacteriaceae bacterium]|nr:two-component regulator propeller domain-containing protein [Cyclobacteriaceae bacterium]